MKKSFLMLALVAALVLTAPALAGEEGKCDHEAQVCLNYLAKNLQGRGWAGVELDEADQTMTVTKVYDDTPARRSGVKVGDQLVAVNGLRLGSENEETKAALQAMWSEMKPGKTFSYTVLRGEKERSIDITLAQMPDDAMQRLVGKHMLEGHATVEVASN